MKLFLKPNSTNFELHVASFSIPSCTIRDAIHTYVYFPVQNVVDRPVADELNTKIQEIMQTIRLDVLSLLR